MSSVLGLCLANSPAEPGLIAQKQAQFQLQDQRATQGMLGRHVHNGASHLTKEINRIVIHNLQCTSKMVTPHSPAIARPRRQASVAC